MRDPYVAIGDLCVVVGGGTPARNVPQYYGGDIPWVTPKDMKTWEIRDAQIKITRAGVENSATRLVPENSVLVVVRSGVLKHTVPVAISRTQVAINQDMKAFICSERVDPDYLARFIKARSPEILKWVRATTADNLPVDKLKKLSMSLPPLSEQRRIAEILDKADALRAKRRAALAKLDSLTQSIFLDMFGDPLTNPQGFPIRTLAEFYVNRAEGTKCGPFGSALKKSELVPDGIPVWNMDNIDPRGRMIMPFRTWISEAKYRQLDAYSVQDGDVIVSRAGTVGKMCVVTTGGMKSIISTNLIRLRFGPHFLPLYFVSLMTYCKGRVGRLKTGADGAFTHMNTGILDALRFPYPPLDRQRQFAKHSESIERHRLRLVSNLSAFDLLFSTLQQRAFSGELRA